MSDLLHRWADLPVDSPIEKLYRHRVIGTQTMLSHVRLLKGCCVPYHAHENEQFAVVLSGLIRFELGEQGTNDVETVEVKGGEVLHLPSNLPHSAIALEETVIIDVFSPPSDVTGIDQN